ncbi:unnamed protein product [Spirodela intermedia]|uniref:Bowman-Birk serine protease inhibitors family domain-containing protein n=2 Tax=Spirodela intermedia TaxID=51605 RepID=A0A7I8IH06_SPIIN|nr:unnamed protein product [Spirodela intermedia]CAA6657159.1 unnamed protein product [Spirodela intermedia]CAA7393173.1 unnamed protein product [Spirodela intermedia]
MEAKKSLTPSALVLALALVACTASWAIPAAARDPFGDLSGTGTGRRASGALECCDLCICGFTWCTCGDRTENYCNPGCKRCQSDFSSWPPYICADTLHYCPDRCGYVAAGSAQGNRATTASLNAGSSDEENSGVGSAA